MDKTYKLKVTWEEDRDYCDVPRLEVMTDEDGKTIYSVCNLNECPEDAIIARNLVSSYEIVKFIEMGMKLAADGYTSVSVEDELVDSVY